MGLGRLRVVTPVGFAPKPKQFNPSCIAASDKAAGIVQTHLRQQLTPQQLKLQQLCATIETTTIEQQQFDPQQLKPHPDAFVHPPSHVPLTINKL
jgi:hypothetical protein